MCITSKLLTNALWLVLHCGLLVFTATSLDHSLHSNTYRFDQNFAVDRDSYTATSLDY